MIFYVCMCLKIILSLLKNDYWFIFCTHAYTSTVHVRFLQFATEYFWIIFLKLYETIILLIYKTDFNFVTYLKIPRLNK